MIKLMHGDCLERMKEIPDGSVDLILTDPPYGTTACKWDSIIPLDSMWSQLNRIIKHEGVIALSGSQPFTSVLVCSNLEMFKYSWVWEKNKSTGHLNSKRQPMRKFEDILIFGNLGVSATSKSHLPYKPQMSDGEPYSGRGGGVESGNDCYRGYGKTRSDNKGERYPENIIKFKSDKGKVHPTQKPVALMEYLIKTYTSESETVLDFTMGSGTTGVACINTNRSFIGIEMDDKYFNIAEERILNHEKQ